jgi:hypothetical protein
LLLPGSTLAGGPEQCHVPALVIVPRLQPSTVRRRGYDEQRAACQAQQVVCHMRCRCLDAAGVGGKVAQGKNQMSPPLRSPPSQTHPSPPIQPGGAPAPSSHTPWNITHRQVLVLKHCTCEAASKRAKELKGSSQAAAHPPWCATGWPILRLQIVIMES